MLIQGKKKRTEFTLYCICAPGEGLQISSSCACTKQDQRSTHPQGTPIDVFRKRKRVNNTLKFYGVRGLFSVDKCATFNTQMCHIQHSNVSHSTLKCVTFNTQMCHIQHSNVPHSTLKCATFNTQMCNIQHSNVQHSTLKCATFNTQMCNIQHSNVQHSTLKCVTFNTQMFLKHYSEIKMMRNKKI
ncbi:hypothetical protein Ddc_10376 [Ditylenchus destructor]|nr:hypothetical protein Ddc_10376 [Ditylenchus destructor]